MSKNLLKIFIMLMVTVLLVSSFVGCGRNEVKGPEPDSQENGKQIEEENEPEHVTYTIFKHLSCPEYPKDGQPAKDIILAAMAEAGIKNVDYVATFVSGADYKTKLNVLVASGDQPDVFQIHSNEIEKFSTAGVITPLDEYYHLMTGYQKLADERDLDALSYEGELYAFPNLFRPEPINGKNLHGIAIRFDWLENLGLEVPKTVDQVYTVLKAFKSDDPDGNGEDDTYGLGGFANQWFNPLFGAYGIYMHNGAPYRSWMEDGSGKVVHSTTLPGTKEVLKLLQDWYKEGLIDPDKFVIGDKQAVEKFSASKFGLYSDDTIWRLHTARSALENVDGEVSGLNDKIVCGMIPAIEGPGGKGIPHPGVRTSGMAVSTKALEKDPQRLFKFLDFSCDIDNGGMMLVTYGVEGEDYKFDEEKQLIYDRIKTADLRGKGFNNPVRFINVMDRRWMDPADERVKDIMLINDPEQIIHSEFYKSVPAMKDYPDVFEKLWPEYFSRIVTGEFSVDKWDEYVEKFYKQGGQQITDEVNEALGR